MTQEYIIFVRIVLTVLQLVVGSNVETLSVSVCWWKEGGGGSWRGLLLW